jgi:hypothetical protein
MDRVGWDVIDAVRAENGWPKVGEMGRVAFRMPTKAAAGASCLGGGPVPFDPLALAAAGAMIVGGSSTEVFERRQPEHVFLAGTAGLDQANIHYTRVVEKG